MAQGETALTREARRDDTMVICGRSRDVEARGPESSGDQRHDPPGRQIARADGSWPTRVLLDPVTHHVFRVVYDSDQGEVVNELHDYRLVDGVFFSFRQLIMTTSVTQEIVIDSVATNLGIEKAQLAAP